MLSQFLFWNGICIINVPMAKDKLDWTGFKMSICHRTANTWENMSRE